ncbi:GNAT family N-acetyltransferase [Oceanicola sp. S124]|uniref:GNAT family N-acetyltransferase n=1 Tax=Oceanicola sp. S124 TaxID=1042378 RepID=UPI00025581B6|nr:GNAT family N-acetyltransferase [Oceanicola sp. S124]
MQSTTLPRHHRAQANGLRYRAETDADGTFLCRLYRSTREEEMAGLPWSEAQRQQFIQMQFSAQHAHYRQHYPDALWLIIEAEGGAAGRLYLDYWPQELRIIDIALLPGARGRGYGGAILRDLQDEASAQGRRIGIHVEKSNRAQQLYRRLGFRPVEDKGVYELLHWIPPGQPVR